VGNLKSVAGSSSSSLCAIFCHFAHRFCFCSQLLLYFRHRRRRLADVLARAVSHVGGLRERGSWSLNRGARILDPGKRDWGPMRLSVALWDASVLDHSGALCVGILHAKWKCCRCLMSSVDFFRGHLQGPLLATPFAFPSYDFLPLRQGQTFSCPARLKYLVDSVLRELSWWICQGKLQLVVTWRASMGETSQRDDILGNYRVYQLAVGDIGYILKDRSRRNLLLYHQ